jgi:histidinol-phosphate aminotransferase
VKTGREAGIAPAPAATLVAAYAPPRAGAPVDLRLDGNEGAAPPAGLLDLVAAAGVEAVRRYPDAAALERLLAATIGVEPSRVLVTAGADDALERLLRAVLAPGRELLLPVPTFEMIPRYARLAGAEVCEVPWLAGPLPVDELIAAGSPRTAAVAIVTPNSPTGLVASAADLARLSAAFPTAALLVDLVYTEFADEDLTPAALALPNAVVTRSFSKAWGLAGLRVGWAAGPASVLGWMRAMGHPYAVSAPSLLLAEARWREGRDDMTRFAAAVKAQRRALAEVLAGLGAPSLPSQGNFVLATFRDAEWVRDGLAGLGIGVRLFPGKPHLEGRIRLTVPGGDADFARLRRGLETVLAPERLVVDLAGLDPSEADAARRAPRRQGVAPVADATSDEVTAPPRTWIATRRREAVEAARRAGALPLGLAAPGGAAAEALTRSGAARCFASLDELFGRWR